MGDLISRSELLKDKVFLCGGFASDYCQGYLDALNAVEKVINEATAIDADPAVHAEWKLYRKQNIFVCTNCSFERNIDDNFGAAIACPNCGADMRKKV